MGQELNEANKKFKKWLNKDLRILKRDYKGKQLEMIKLICFAYYLRGWCDKGEK